MQADGFDDGGREPRREAVGTDVLVSGVDPLVGDILAEIVATDRELARKIYLMTDCMSAVTVPDGKGGFVADFTGEAEGALQRFADAGMNLVKSTDPLASWLR